MLRNFDADVMPVDMADKESLLRLRLGQQLRQARLAKKLTQGALAELVTTDPETISRFERGATLPSLVRLLELAEALEVSLSFLLGAASPRGTDEIEAMQHALAALSDDDRRLAMALIQAILHDRLSGHRKQ